MKLLAHASSGIIHIIAMYFFYRCFFTQYKLRKELVIGIYILNGIYGIVYPMFTETVSPAAPTALVTSMVASFSVAPPKGV